MVINLPHISINVFYFFIISDFVYQRLIKDHVYINNYLNIHSIHKKVN